MNQTDPYQATPEFQYVTFSDVTRNTQLIWAAHGPYLLKGYLVIACLVTLFQVMVSSTSIAITYFLPSTNAAYLGSLLAVAALSFVLYFIYYAINLGLYRPFHQIVETGQPQSRLSKSFLSTVFERFGPLLLFSILSTIGIVLGLFLCVIPGVILAVLTPAAGYLVATRTIGTVDAYRQSATILSNNLGPIFIIYLLLIAAGAIIFVPLQFAIGIISVPLSVHFIGALLVSFISPLVSLAFGAISWFIIGSLYNTTIDGGPPQPHTDW